MFKKFVLTVLILGFMVGVSFAGGVQSDNNGNAGYLFVATGENHGKDSIGVWTDPSELGLKGEKGDVGATGATGEAGRDGINGLNGVDGTVGPQGDKGDIGQNGEQGIAGSDGKNGEKGKTGDKGQQGIQGPQGKGLEDRVELIGEIRILDTRKTTWSVYAGRDFNNNANIVGAKVVYKLGKSYEESRLDNLEKKLNLLETQPEENVTIVPTATGFKVQVNR